MTPSRHRLTNYRTIPPRGIIAADSKRFEALGKGDLVTEIPNGDNKSTKVFVWDVLYAPMLGATLISVSQITQGGYSLHFRGQECRIFDAKDRCIGSVPLVHGLYRNWMRHSLPRRMNVCHVCMAE
ncbi:hypothetical protein C8F04DRAFT_1122797 [Mycena alexandri]|uniref:Retrovirus-related Pol polyprotein from transposon TNT 1-94-like beta-barrel domain-containing protein n=1 Tax=Mycena alexandri TaxID=1745969 RepID=A0AAD6SH13_9AGAR|nr:hypothetical protein C8F04DRAFT_1122797 [Mycena alexandri]